MKYLSNYVEEAQTALFTKTGTFFAFSEEQFNQSKKLGVEYEFLGSGMVCPKDNVIDLEAGLDRVRANGIAQDLAENSKEAIIERELHNYECFHVMDISDAVGALEPYQITRDEVVKVYNTLRPTIEY